MTYKGKLLLNFTVLFAVFTALLVFFQSNREQRYKRDLLETRLRCYADIVAGEVNDSLKAGHTLSLEDLPHILPSDLRLTIIDRKGKVCYDTHRERVKKMGNHLSRHEVAMALHHAEGTDLRTSATDGREYFYYAKAYNGYIVRVALPYDATVRSLMKADNVFLWFVLMLFPVALVVLIYISDRFGKAVSGLRDFMQTADRGLVDYDHITFPKSELGSIGRSIMEKYKELESSNRQISNERERLMRHFHYFEEGIAVFSPDHHCLYANPRFTQYANVLLERPTANLSLIWQDKPFKPIEEFLSINGGPRPVTEEAPVFRYTTSAGGSTFAIQVLVYADGSFEVTLSDVTRSEKARKLKQQMSNNITHELRTPISSIRGYIETIIDCPNLPEERKRYFLQKAHAQVVRLTDLVRDVALITKTEEAADLMPREEVEIAKVISDAQEDLHDGFVKAKMTLHTQLPPKLTIHGNYTLIYSIFRNLMENSLRYSGEGTEIHINCYEATDEFAYFSFYDTGQGVPKEHLARLFERFYRVTEGRTRENGGTGLGLSIVRNAVRFHHGDISVKNRPEGGLEFLFSLRR